MEDNTLDGLASSIHNNKDVRGAIDSAFKQMSSAELQEFYNKWATSYDEDLDRMAGGYNNPQHLVNFVIKHVPNRQASILDIACGTGRVGRLLQHAGYTHVDGHDGNQAMLDIARDNNLYKNYYLEFIDDSPMKTISSGFYDAVITTGSFTRGHLTAKCLKPIGLCVKPKGLLIIAMRGVALDWPDFQDMEPRMAELEREGFWKQRYRGVIEKYIGDETGMAYIYEKM